MGISYDVFAGSFLAKIREYDFCKMYELDRDAVVDGYMKRAIAAFKDICKYDLVSTADDSKRIFDLDIPANDIDEIVDIISEGMLVQWMKPYLYKQENLESVLNTRDFTTYSPAELLYRIGSAHKEANKHFKNMMREYSYRHADLSELHI